VIHTSSENFVNWDVIKNQEVVTKTKYCTHYRFSQPFTIKMDGKKRMGVIEAR
jgi:hypothetical protein